MKTKCILIVGASSGVGNDLAKSLIRQGHTVWAVARRREGLEALKNSSGGSENVRYSTADISKESDVLSLSEEVKNSGLLIDAVVINAGIYKNDMSDNINPQACREVMETNFWGAIYCVNALKPLIAKNGQFIAISSSSALKGSAHEGAGYAASKAALSVAFESFQMKWGYTGQIYTTIFFGPLDSTLRRTKGGSIFETSAPKAVAVILHALKQRRPVYHQPKLLFFLMRAAKVLPAGIYLKFLTFVESRMNQEAR